MKGSKMRSPLKDPVLRLPGTYAREKTIDLAFSLPGYFVLWACLLTLMVSEWNHFFGNISPNPWITTIIFFCYSVFFYFRFQNVFKEIINYKLGKDGEVMVGQIFEGLRPFGYTPIHDVPCVGKNGKGFNIDHVLIGPTGIFAVETKTWSKKLGEDEKILYKNNILYTGSREMGEYEITQAKNNAEWLANLLKGRLGKTYEVRPVLTFPGWYVDQEATSLIKQKYGVYALNPKVIGVYLDKNFDCSLETDQVKQIANSISSYMYEQAEIDLKK